jgi:hypothetical protein
MDYNIIVLALLISILCFLYHRLIVAICLFVFFSPAFIFISLVRLALKISGKISQLYLKQGRYTIWTFGTIKLINLYLDTYDETLISFKKLLGERKMVVVKKAGEKLTYVAKEDREKPQQEQTVFFFRKIGSSERASSRDKMLKLNKKGRVETIASASSNLELTLTSLEGWSNLVDEAGVQIPFDKANKQACFDMLPYEVQDELIEFVAAANRASDSGDDEAEDAEE